MHHKNHKNSSSNHGNPQHQKPNYPSAPAPSSQKKSVLSRIRERFQEKPATKEEIAQLRLNTQREILKTQRQRAKAARPSRFGGISGSSGPSYRRSSPRAPRDSGMFSSGGQGSFLDFGSGPSLSFLTGNNSQGRSRGKRQPSGLEELF